MPVVELLSSVAFAGGEWVIWVLFALSVVAVAVMLDRVIVFHREKVLFPGQIRRVEERLRGLEGPADADAAAGRTSARQTSPGTATMFERALAAADSDRARAGLIGDRLELERRLVILGSLGSLSPWVGLFGSVRP